ncbi:MAG: hypothetical protein ACMUIP_14055 [bacterium]
MNNYKPLKAAIILIIVVGFLALMTGTNAHSQYSTDPWSIIIWPPLAIFPDPLATIILQQISPYYFYPYYNSINGYLLGFSTFSPFLPPDIASKYAIADIPTYPYPSSPYEITFPSATLPDSFFPYAQPAYPTYVYGTPDIYLNWVLLQ